VNAGVGLDTLPAVGICRLPLYDRSYPRYLGIRERFGVGGIREVINVVERGCGWWEISRFFFLLSRSSQLVRSREEGRGCRAQESEGESCRHELVLAPLPADVRDLEVK